MQRQRQSKYRQLLALPNNPKMAMLFLSSPALSASILPPLWPPSLVVASLALSYHLQPFSAYLLPLWPPSLSAASLAFYRLLPSAAVLPPLRISSLAASQLNVLQFPLPLTFGKKTSAPLPPPLPSALPPAFLFRIPAIALKVLRYVSTSGLPVFLAAH